MSNKEGFVSDAARLAWKLFESTGEINYYNLYYIITNATEIVDKIFDENSMDGRDL